MKKLFYSILAAAATLFTVACHQETATRFDEGGIADVSFQVSLPGLQTKAYGDGTTADSLVVMVFKANGGDYEYLPDVKPIPEDPEFDNLTATVNLKLVRGLSYRILFWAQNSYPGLYEIDHEQGTVTMLTQGGIPANDERYDAFFVNWEGAVGNEPIQESVELRRPFAQVNVIAPKADAEAALANGITPGGSSMTVTAPTKLDLITGEVSEEAQIEFYETPIDEPVNIPGYDAAEYDYIAMNYIFADADAALLNQLEFAVYEDGGNMIGDPFQLPNVPVCRNYRTVLIGNVFSVDATFEVTIISEFGDAIVVPLEDAEDQSIVLDGTAGSLNGEPGIGSILIDDPQAPGSFNTTLQIGDKLDFGGVFFSNSGFDPHYSSTNEEVGKFAANPGDAESLFTALAAGETQIKVHFNAVINGEEQTKAESKNFKSAEVIVNITVEAEPEPGDDAVYALYSGAVVEGYYVIVYGDYAMNNEADSNNRIQYETVTIENDAIVNPDESIVWYIAQNGDYWTIYNEDVQKYAASTGAKNKAAVIADGTDAKAQWIIEKQAATDTAPVTYEIENVSNKAAEVNYTLRNNGTYGFACYGKNTGGTLSLYKLVDGGADPTTYTVTVDPAIVESEENVGGVWIEGGNDLVYEYDFEAGATVNLVYDPIGDYDLTALYYLDENQEPVEIEFEDGAASFEMPAYNITLYATFEEPGNYTVTIDPAIVQDEENVGGVWIEGGNDLVYEYEFENGATVNLVYDPIGDYDLTALYYLDDNQEPVEIEFEDGAASFEMPAYNITIYATFEEVVEPGDDAVYALYAGAIVEGYYVIVYGNYAMNNEADSNNRIQYETVTIENDAIVNPDESIVWYIAQNGDYWTIYNEDVQKYAASTGVKNKAVVIADGTDAKAQWTITKQAATDTAPVTYEIENVSNKAAGVNSLLRNNGTYGFACYAAATGGTLSLYRLVDGDAPVVVDQVAAPAFSVAAGEVQSGTEVTITCATDGATIWYKIDNAADWSEYDAPISVDAAMTIIAKATKSEMLDSEEVSVSYTVASQEQTFYNITIYPEMSNGTVTPEYEQAQPGDQVALTIVPEDGMALVAGSLKYTDEAGGNETVIQFAVDPTAPVLTYTATLVMPAFNVVVYAEFDEPQEPETFTSNVTMGCGTNCYNDNVLNVNEVQGVANIKMGKSSAFGDGTITLPAGTKVVSFYAVGWSGKPASLKFSNGETVLFTCDIAANSGATGTAPYNITVTSSDWYSFELDEELAAETVVKVETYSGNNSGYRAFLFAVNAVATNE